MFRDRISMWRYLATFVSLTFAPSFALADDWAEPGRVAEVEAGEREEADVTWWGFDAGDSTEFVQAALDSGASHITIPDTGQTWFLQAEIALSHDGQTLFFEEGVDVKAKAESVSGRADNLFRIRGLEDITITGHGATLRMPYVEMEDRDTRMGGHLIFVDGSSQIVIEGLTLEQAHRDAIYVGGHQYCRDITVREVVTDGNWRQGISIVSVDGMLVEDSVFKNTGGKAPGAGIDAETHGTDERIANVVVRNNEFLDNRNYGIHNWISGPPDPDVPVSIVWEGNYIQGGQIGLHVGHIHEDVPGGEIIFRDNVVEDTLTAGILVRSAAVGADVQIEFIGNRLRNTSIGDLDQWWLPKAPIVLHPRHIEQYPQQGHIRFEDTMIEQRNAFDDRPAVKVAVRDGFESWQNVTGTIIVDAPGAIPTDIRGLGETSDLEVRRALSNY